MKRLIIAFVIVTVSSCNLFDKDERLLAEHLKSNGEKINIYYVSLGATTNDVIQVRKAGQDSIIWANDKYNNLEDSKLIKDTILQMVLSDTGFNMKNNKSDTVNIRIKSELSSSWVFSRAKQIKDKHRFGWDKICLRARAVFRR